MSGQSTVSGMVTRIGKGRRQHLYLREWMDHRGLSDETLGLRLGLSRQTIYRWRKEQWRIDTEKMALLAEALDIDPRDLWGPPSRRSVDAITQGLPDEIHGDVVEFAEKLRKRAS